MREEIENSINDIFNTLEPNKDSNITNEDINNLTDENNKKVLEDIEYRKELFDKLEEIKELGFIVEYNDNMTNEQLEDIINNVQY